MIVILGDRIFFTGPFDDTFGEAAPKEGLELGARERVDDGIENSRAFGAQSGQSGRERRDVAVDVAAAELSD